MEFRAARAADGEAVAALHADSWRRNYRGALSDEFLDSDVFQDRRSLWARRLSEPSPGEFAIIAARDQTVLGFAYTILREHPEWGALLDNLHVSHELKGQGIGTRLMAETARELTIRDAASGLYLTVLEQNTAGQAFYDARGGTRVEPAVSGTLPDGRTAPEFVYRWPDPSILL
jgi:ribosomal protein S18 acetylase RimI-like enzyme